MTRKKPMRPSSAEAHTASVAPAPTAAWQRARDMVHKRLTSTGVQRLLDDAPRRFAHALDRVLDRVGLVRKSTLEGAGHSASSTAGAQLP